MAGRSVALAALALAVASPAAARASGCRAALPPYAGVHPLEAMPAAPYYGLRIMGMGGAFTGVAEGAEGIPTSLASLANRRPNQAGFFDWDVALSWDIPTQTVDVENDGCGAPAGMRLAAIGGLLRFGRVGIGLFLDGVSFDGAGAKVNPATQVLRPIFGVAYALPGDAWVFGAGFDYVSYTLNLDTGGKLEATGQGFVADGLFRPRGLPFRVGVSVKLPAVARLGTHAGTGAPPAVVRPLEVSVGGSWWIGDGELNQPMPVTSASKARPPATTGLLLAADVFVLGDGTVDGSRAAGIEAFDAGKLQLVTQGLRWGARLGGETVAIPGHVRLRGGLWLEPARFAGVGPRLHLTGGIDVFLFHFLGVGWRGSFAYDVAASYLVTSISLGFW